MYSIAPFSEIISIHALREESDDGRGMRDGYSRISIHALREESDCSTHLLCR